MKIYTKGGDKGKTSLIGGERVFKNDIQVDAYGTIDELISWIGLIRSHESSNSFVMNHKKINGLLFNIQSNLMSCASIVSKQKDYDINLPNINDEDINILEKSIDYMTDRLPPLDSFILPGGNVISSYCHISRTVCRRAERLVIETSIVKEITTNEMVIKYLNRLSDFLFTLSRFVNDNEMKWIHK